MASDDDKEADAGMERSKDLANKVLRLLNAAKHPADAMTALQLVVAAVLDHTGIDPQIFMHRVFVSVERIRSGSIATKEPSHGR